MWGVRGRALSHPRPLVLSGVRPGPTTHWLWVRGMPAWGPVTNPTARTLACRLCARWGRHEGAWRGSVLPGCRASGVGLSPTPDLSSFRACGPGPATHWLWVRGVRAWGPHNNPTAHALASWPCALWGRYEGARGGASCLGVGRPGLGAPQPPTTRPFGRAAGATYPLAVGAGGAGVGTRQQPHSARSYELASRTVGAA